MISKNRNLAYLKLNRRHKLDPNEPSEITLELDLDESEAKIAFQCIFGQADQIDVISDKVRTLHITIYWDKDQLGVMSPKFMLYRFSSGFTIVVRPPNNNIAFDRRSILVSETEYERMIYYWKTTESPDIFDPTAEQFTAFRFDEIEHKKPFLDAILSGERFATTQYHIVRGLPMSVSYNPDSVQPIVGLVHGRGDDGIFTEASAGTVFNRIFEKGFTLIKEIYPPFEVLSNNLAKLRNSHHDKYNDLRVAFKNITADVEVLVEQGTDGAERIQFIEAGRKYGIDDSASGYYALTSILWQLLGGMSGLVAIDEPEIHLHPGMSSRLHDMLGKMARKNGAQIVVVTHSPRFVTYKQIKKMDESKLIMVMRQDSASQAHTDTEESEPKIKPHLFDREIFFGSGTMIVEGPSDYFVQRAISDYYGGLFEKYNIILVSCGGKRNIPAQVDLHDRFRIPYHCMADGDYEDDLEHMTKLDGDLEAELEKIGVECVNSKEGDYVYGKMMEFLKKPNGKEWRESGIWRAFDEIVQKAGGSVPSGPDADA